MTEAASTPLPAKDTLYTSDFYTWTQVQADILRARRFGDLDIENLIDEVASVGASEKREIRSRLAVLITHLLNWTYQPGARSSSWRGTIDQQRTALDDIVSASPSLRWYPSEVFEACYRTGHLEAAEQTGIDFTLFAERPPFTIEQTRDDGYVPKEPDLMDQS